jgi:hypothetical protein
MDGWMEGWMDFTPMKLSEKNGEEWNPYRVPSISAHSNNTHYFG